MRRTGVRLVALLALLTVLAGGAVIVSALSDRPSTTVRADMVVVAPRALVWRLLTDFERYESWNPFITQARGDARVGETLHLQIEPESEDAKDIECKVLDIKEKRKLRWLCRRYLPGLLDEEHTFHVLPLGPDRVQLVYDGRFEGVLEPFTDLDATKRGYEQMTDALRDRAQRG